MKFTTSLIAAALACTTASALDLTNSIETCQIREKVVHHLLDSFVGYQYENDSGI